MTAIVIVLQLVGGATDSNLFHFTRSSSHCRRSGALRQGSGRLAGICVRRGGYSVGRRVGLSCRQRVRNPRDLPSQGCSCGPFCAGAVYKLFEKTNTVLATALAAVAAPIVNTGVFLSRLQRVLPRHRQGLGRRRGSRKRRSIYVCGLRGNKFLSSLPSTSCFAPSLSESWARERKIKA